jgi:hypothetical protein
VTAWEVGTTSMPVPPRVDGLGEHPWWCSPQYCTAGARLGDHRSAPWRVKPPAGRCGYAVVQVALWMDAYTEVTDAASVELQVFGRVGCGPQATVVVHTFELAAEQLRQLAAGCVAVADLHDLHDARRRTPETAGGR